MRAGIALFLVLPALAGAQAAPDYDASASSVRKLLGELVEADTSNPPGNEARAVALGAARLKEAGIEYQVTEFAPGRENLVARLEGDGSQRPLLILAHIDVVGAQGQAWSTEPHKMQEVDGYLVGRGVSDDLGMAAIALEVLIQLKKLDVPLRRDVIVAWTGDEESGGAGIRYLLEHAKESIDAELALNEGGAPVLDEGGKVVRIGLQTAEKIYQDYEIVAKGKTGHSSVPLDDNAIYRLCAALTRLGAHRFPSRLLPVTRAFWTERIAMEKPEIAEALRKLVASQGEIPAEVLQRLESEPGVRATLRTTCVATLVSAGTRVNALPADAKATVNCRILPDETPADVLRQLVAVLDDPALEVQALPGFGHGPPSPVEGPGPEAIKKVAAEMWPGAPVIPNMSLGATDSRFLREVGIPAYGIRPTASTDEDSRRAHGVDERIPASSLRSGMEFFWRLVTELAAKR